MAVGNQTITDRYAMYLGDCIEVMTKLPSERVHLSVYSPPFGGLFHYSSSDRDLSNARNYKEFFEHYRFVVKELYRLTMPGRITAVHTADVPSGNSGNSDLTDFPGDVIRLHQEEGWRYVARYAVWKEPFAVRMRTLRKGLAHQTVVQDASRCENAAADYLVVFRRKGDNPTPIEHQGGLTEYAGERPIPKELLRYRGWTGKQTANRLSHWIWRQYASAFWDDVRIGRTLPYKEAKSEEDERHIHPLQLDVIERCVILWSNPGETVLTPFMGIGSEVFAALQEGRRAIGIELKPNYYQQAVKHIEGLAERGYQRDDGQQMDLPDMPLPGRMDVGEE